MFLQIRQSESRCELVEERPGEPGTVSMACVPMFNLPGTINCVVVRESNFVPVNSYMISTPHDCSTTHQDQQHAIHERKTTTSSYVQHTHAQREAPHRARHRVHPSPCGTARHALHGARSAPIPDFKPPRPVRPANPTVPGRVTQSRSTWSSIIIHPSIQPLSSYSAPTPSPPPTHTAGVQRKDVP